MISRIKEIVKESINVKEKLILNCLADIEKITCSCLESLNKGGKIIFCGNGGSAADAQHLAAEFIVRFKKERRPLAAIALTVNTSVITALGNDYSYEEIFSRQIEGLAKKNDILIAISTSGKAKNIIAAINIAKKIGTGTIAFTGENGRDFAKMCDFSLIVPSKDTARIQESHICVGHVICELVEDSIVSTNIV